RLLGRVNRIFARVFKLGDNPSLWARIAYKAGSTATVVAMLQALAEAQYFAEHREGMGSGRTRTVAQNLITTVVLELGHFIIKPSAMRGVADIDAVLTKQLASLDGERAALSEKLDALSAGKLTEGERDELLAKLQALYARDVAFLDDAMRRGVKAPALRAAIA